MEHVAVGGVGLLLAAGRHQPSVLIWTVSRGQLGIFAEFMTVINPG